MTFINDFKESNRWKHFLYGIPTALIFTILCTLGVGAGMELKDKLYGNQWDWKDFGFTMLGGSIGQILQAIILWLLL